MTAAVTANSVKPLGPVLGMRRAKRIAGYPPGGGPSCIAGMSLTDCAQGHGLSAPLGLKLSAQPLRRPA